MLWEIVLGLYLLHHAIRRLLVYVHTHQSVGNLPGIWCLFAPLSVLGGTLPSRWWNPGLRFTFELRKTLYKDAPAKSITIKPLLVGEPYIYTCHLEAFRQVTALGSVFVKPRFAFEDMTFLADNVVASEGDAWKRYRRIAAPAFNSKTYEAVWDTTVDLYGQILDKENWETRDVAEVADINIMTHKVALYAIAVVGFDIPIQWDQPPRDENGRLSVQEMVFTVASNLLIKSRTPKWMYSLGLPRLKLVDEAYNQFVSFMHEHISNSEVTLTKQRELEGDITEGISNVFERLVNARLTDGKLSMSDDEIISNCFILVFAGHETMASTLAGTLALLGVYPDVQEEVYQHIMHVLGGRDPTFEDYESLDLVLGCFYEALRLYSAAYLLIRDATENTVLSLPRYDDPTTIDKIPITAGQRVILDIVGIHYDPDVFPEPEAFKPSRWQDSMDSLAGFSLGPRICLGRKFATVEAVAFLTYLLRDWTIDVPLADGETRREWRARVLDPKVGVVLGFGDVPLKFRRRHA
ncbi:cytochrome P450 [Rickenella mellea]|uniref:Cytochrome P450 n=1 Tax=Rickenella mellea TaxID=50990 RepID=A0A4Y7QJI4_9AGAM|nr:cytochrome P450 [Rickenella mellea]